MAKKNNTADANANAEAAAPQLDENGNPIVAAAAAPAADKRHKKLTFTDPATGETKEWNRIDLIRHFITPTDGALNEGKVGLGWSRSEATAKIRELTGDANFRYQIVFQASKGINGVKAAEKKVKPEAAAPTGEAPAAA